MTDRGPDGKFIKGNKASPGRAPREREERYYQILMTACTFDEWKDIVKKAASQAKRGDAQARKWLADYVVGSPIQRVEQTGKDGGPQRITFEWVDK